MEAITVGGVSVWNVLGLCLTFRDRVVVSSSREGPDLKVRQRNVGHQSGTRHHITEE